MLSLGDGSLNLRKDRVDTLGIWVKENLLNLLLELLKDLKGLHRLMLRLSRGGKLRCG